MATSRIWNFWTVPITVLGNPPTNFQCRGILLSYQVGFVSNRNRETDRFQVDLTDVVATNATPMVRSSCTVPGG